MKRHLFFLLTTILSFNCYSQISYEKGYYIDNNNQRVNCLIKNVDWNNNPTEFEYKLSENSEPRIATLKYVKEFGVNNTSKYIKSTVNIDRSSEVVENLSRTRDPIFKEEELFLKVLVEGKSSLYQYVEGHLKRYFYNKDNSNIEQLVFKSYKNDENKVVENNMFKQQLKDDLKCPNFTTNKIENLEYNKKKLVNFFVEYNNCNHQEYVNYEVKKKRDMFNLTVRPRINHSSLEVQNILFDYYNTEFENKLNFGFGVEAEFIFPFNKNKWSIVIEPTYQYFKTEKTNNVNIVSGGELISNVDYSSIEMPVGIRYYFFLNNNSKIFINASYVLDFSSKSSIEYTRNDGSIFRSYDVKTKPNYAFGMGYKHNDTYSLELRYQTKREILSDYYYFKSDYKTISMIFGYSLFHKTTKNNANNK